jgi:hypothetical protein
VSVEVDLLNGLKAAQQQFALDALKRPVNRDNFEYGYRVGMVAGYEAALNLLLDLVRRERDDEKDL